MTVARDSFVEGAAFAGTTPFDFTGPVPVGTPRSVTVFISHGTDATDRITGVTYGGVAMTRVATNGFAGDATGEPGAVYAYHLGASIPTGQQTISITHDGAVVNKWAIVVLDTAAADTEIIVSGKLEGDQADPQIALDTTATSSLRKSILFSGKNDISTLAVLSGMEAIGTANTHDFGATLALMGEQTTASTGSFTIGYTATTDDVAMIAIAIQEVGGGTPHAVSETDDEGLVDDAAPVTTYQRGEDAPLGLTDTTERQTDQVRSSDDSLGIFDSINVDAAGGRTVTDDVGIIDQASTQSDQLRSTDDDLGLSDSIVVSRGVNLTVSDALGLADDGEWLEVRADALGLTDSIVVETTGSHLRTADDALELTDVITVDHSSGAVDHTVTITDALGLTDAATFTATYDFMLIDQLGLVDDVSFPEEIGIPGWPVSTSADGWPVSTSAEGWPVSTLEG